jgi:hypothetical protein
LNPVPVSLDLAVAADGLGELRLLAEGGRPVILEGLDRLEPGAASSLLTFFLHDPVVTAPVEPFATLLAAMVHRRDRGLWDLVSGTRQNEAEAGFLRTLPVEQPECLACSCFPVCQGYGAWAGSCATWRTLLTDLAAAARELGRLHPRKSRRPIQRGDHVSS